MERLSQAYDLLLYGSAVFLMFLIFAILMRAIKGPRFTDRIVAINVICTKVVIMIAILSARNEDAGLLDVALVYAMINILAVVILSKCYVTFFHIEPIELRNGKADTSGIIDDGDEEE